MDMIRNKKAILFSLISVLFAILFITLFSHNFSTYLEDRMPGSNVRIRVMDVYTRNFETYVSDSIQIATYKTLEAITERQKNAGIGTFFNNFEEFNFTFHECMLCGYTNCSDQTLINNCDLDDYDLLSRIENISQLSLQQMNIKTDYTINSVEIFQEYPFEVEVMVGISYEITDASGEEQYAKWSKTKNITESVPITGLLDPAGYINDTTYDRRIKRYTGPCEFDESCWNYTNTQAFYVEESFRYYVNSTSFLQRYWNDNTHSTCCGIETILHPSELSSPMLENSYIDQFYWSEQYTCSDLNRIATVRLNGDEVHIDEDTMLRYGLGANSTLYCYRS